MLFRSGRQALAAAGAALAAVALSQVLKVLLAHPRTQAVIEGDILGPEALPSGHATAAMSVAVMAVLCTPLDLRRWAVGLGAFYAWAVSTCLVILAWHLPSDVLSGMLLAAGCGFASMLVSPRLPRWLNSLHGPIPAAILVAAYLVVILGIGAFIVAAITGTERAGQALTFAHTHRSAAVAAAVLALLPTILLTSLALATGRNLK